MAELRIQLSVPETPGLRGERGRFLSEGVRELMDRNRAYAENMRADVARRMENRIMVGGGIRGRAAASTGHLVAVTASPKNQRVDRWSFGVGDIDYLNRSSAKYWRTFEEGSAAVWRHPFIGTHLMKVYSMKGPSPHGTNLVTLTGPANFRNNAGRDLFVVRREIEPAHIYRDVAQAAHLQEFGLRSTRLFLERIFNTPVKQFPPRTRSWAGGAGGHMIEPGSTVGFNV